MPARELLEAVRRAEPLAKRVTRLPQSPSDVSDFRVTVSGVTAAIWSSF
jgi:hypothetical protein